MDINKILAMPLALPKFEPDSWDTFWNIWERDKTLYVRLRPDSVGNNSPVPSWQGFNWHFDHSHKFTMFDIPSNDYSDIFPKFKKQLEDFFPFKILNILFQSNVKTIDLHKDGNPHTDHLPYPASVRILLHDPNKEPNFYFLNKNLIQGKFLKLPEDTNSFVFNNPKILHGAKFYGQEKILMHIVCNDIDELRWFELLSNSYNKYKNIFSIVD